MIHVSMGGGGGGVSGGGTSFLSGGCSPSRGISFGGGVFKKHCRIGEG